jgi:hypothetical protein
MYMIKHVGEGRKERYKEMMAVKEFAQKEGY